MSFRASAAAVRALPARQRGILLRAALLLAAYSLGLKILGVRRTEALLSRRVAAARDDASIDAIPRLVAAAVRRAPWRPACLPACLAAKRLLASHGCDAELRVGVRSTNGGMEAHAWLEHHGRRVFDLREAGVEFAPFDGPIDLGPRRA